MACGREYTTMPLFLFEHMIMRLMLKLQRRKFWLEMSAQEGYAIALVAIQAQPHPDEMQMFWHQAIDRAKHGFAGGSVKHKFTESPMKSLIQPPLLA
jgi:hypothetical protein